MPKKEIIINESKVKYRGVFDLNRVYNYLRQWIMDAGYSDPVKEESKYAEKVKPGGKDIEIIWNSSKKEVNGYFDMSINVKFYITKMTEVEADNEGNKLKLHKGDLWIYFTSTFTMNAKSEWNEHSLMYKIYDKYIVTERREQFKIVLYNSTNSIIKELKNFLSLYSA